jgi:polysaccharide export outer membrane protein
MGVGVSGFQTENVPTIYRLDLKSPRGFFLAGQFPMRNHDVLYVSNSHSVELVKFLTIVRSVTSAVRGVAFDVDDLGNL